ncbi:MAG: SAM-dependent methyltransferase, partial [Planctomycetota bacterium]
PGVIILIVNHFLIENPYIARVFDKAVKITTRLGWRTDLDLDEVIRELPLTMDRRYKTNPLSLFTVMKATRE